LYSLILWGDSLVVFKPQGDTQKNNLPFTNKFFEGGVEFFRASVDRSHGVEH